jgi:hypothetical protein
MIGAPELPWILVARSDASDSQKPKELVAALSPLCTRVDQLKPQNRNAARCNTLSSRHGLGNFPLHTDFAMDDRPPRYVMLIAARARKAATLLLNSNALVREFGDAYLRRCLFLQSGRPARYRRLLTTTSRGRLFRYNGAVMTPINCEAERVSEFLATATEISMRIDWFNTRLAVIDNWAVLHGREACDATDGVALRRIAIWTASE